jgi:ribulose-5-phosphate 4-epimerase/fuculose-1-phosphate aldolase
MHCQAPKKIRRGVGDSPEKVATGNALILKNHGAVCFGEDDQEAFRVATQLEEACTEFIATKYTNPLAKKATFSSKRTENGFLVELPGGERLEVNMQEAVGTMPRDLDVHFAIYKERKKINFIRHVASGNVLAFSQTNMTLLPLVDDFAQIIGTKVQTVDENPKAIAAALKNTSAVFIEGQGALCCGANEMDVQAVEMILEKCCKAGLCGEFFVGAKPIGWFDSKLMRRVYLKKYSKQIG